MEKEFEELKKLAEPLQKWLTSNFNPMCSVVVEMDRVSLVSTDLSIPTENIED